MSAFLRHFLGHARRRVALSLFLQTAAATLEAVGLMLLMPLMGLLGLGRVAAAGRVQDLWQHAFTAIGLGISVETVLGGFVTTLILQASVRRLADHVNARIEAEYTFELRSAFYQSLVRAKWRAFSRLRTADLTRTLAQEIDHVGVAVQQLMLLAGAVGIALAQVGMAALLSPSLTAVALACGAIVAVGLRPLTRRVRAAAQASQRKRAEMNTLITEHVGAFKLAKSHGRGAQHVSDFTRVTRAIAQQLVASHQAMATTRICFELATWIAVAAFLYVAFAWIALPTAQLALMVFVFMRLMPRLVAIQTIWQRLIHFQNSFDVVRTMQAQLDSAAEAEASPEAPAITLKNEIRLEGVSFQYESGVTSALAGIDAVFPARQITAITGPSGAGKSTLADMVLGLLTPANGRVLIDGLPLEGARLAGWRRSIGYVPQEPFLFHDTIRANLLWARPEATEEELQAVLVAAAADKFVAQLPRALDTIVGDRGVLLSGGERQRLTLARALLVRPTLLLLDEATSALDMANERFVQEAISALHGTVTIIVIAHRLSTIETADQVILLEQGRVIDSGAPRDLTTRPNSPFRRLMRTTWTSPSAPDLGK